MEIRKIDEHRSPLNSLTGVFFKSSHKFCVEFLFVFSSYFTMAIFPRFFFGGEVHR